MANGFRNLRINLDRRLPPNERVRFSDDNACLLAGSRFLNPDLDHSDSMSPTGALTIGRSSEGNCSIRLTASDDKALLAAVFFDGVMGSVVGSQELKGKSQDVELVLPLKHEKATGKPKLSVQIIDRGGNILKVENE